MQPSENQRPWWKKFVAIWSDKERQQASALAADNQAESPGEKRAAPEAGQSQMLTQYERHKIRMAKHTEEENARNSKRLASSPAEKRSRDNKRLMNARRVRLIRDQRDALRLKKAQCRNTWGRLEPAEWNKVLDQFIRTVLRAPSSEWPNWKKRVNLVVGTAPLKRVKISRSDLGSNFEFEVAAQLRGLGWSVQFLGKSGDQGGDLLAQKEGKSIVIQCKKHGAKVGNGAVQEVAAARNFYQASLAAVVGDSGFTRQAQSLADKTSVMLLSTAQLAMAG